MASTQRSQAANAAAFTRILVVADRDDAKQVAVRAAVDLAGTTSSVNATELIVVGFVFDPACEKDGPLQSQAAKRLKARLLREKRDWLRAALSGVELGRARLSTEVVWTKDIAQWVCEVAIARGIDLVVKTRNRSEGMIHTPLDWRLLRRSRVPVLIVSSRLKKRGRVLATVDLGSKAAAQRQLNRQVLEKAVQVARQFDQDIGVVYAVPVSAVAMDLDLVDAHALELTMREKLKGAVDELVRKFDIPAQSVRIKAGPPDRVIAGAATRLKASLVIMGTIGRSGVKGKLLGNTAEQVLHRVKANVLALRPEPPRPRQRS